MDIKELNLKNGLLLKTKKELNFSNIPVVDMKNKIVWYTIPKDELVFYLCCYEITDGNSVLYETNNFKTASFKLLVDNRILYHDFEFYNEKDFKKQFESCYEGVYK